MSTNGPDTWQAQMRLPRELHARVAEYAKQRAEVAGVPVSFAAAVRMLLERGLADVARKR